MEEKTYKPKLRITTLEDNGSYIQDRLVDAYTEMNSGPKVQHKGPIRIEVTLTNKQDVENFKNYLDKLVGNLPIKNLQWEEEDLLLGVNNLLNHQEKISWQM